MRIASELRVDHVRIDIPFQKKVPMDDNDIDAQEVGGNELAVQ